MFGPTLGANVRVVELPNTTHVTSEGDGVLMVGARCARAVIRAFVRAPERLASLAPAAPPESPTSTRRAPTRCGWRRDSRNARVGPGPGVQSRRAVTVAAGALADAPVRYWFSGAARGAGLRGGSFTAKGYPFVRLRLRGVRFAGDAPVSGTGSWRFSDGATRGTLAVRLPSGGVVHVKLSWTQRSLLARARVGSSILSLPAP